MKKMISFIKYRKIYYAVSGTIMLICILSLVFWRLNLGIDFKGGSLIELKIKNEKLKIEEIKQTVGEIGVKNITVQTTGQSYIIRTEEISTEKQNEIVQKVKDKAGDTEELRRETIGPTVGKDLMTKAIIAVCLATLGIGLYIAWTFRRVTRPIPSWVMAAATIIALIHDIIFTLGLFSILGYFLGYEIGSFFLVAVLTILGFSVHDTIVVFDRVRENLLKAPANQPLEETCNISIDQTLARSLNTSLTVILVLLTLLLLGGTTIRPFVLALVAGIAVGTYSSIFIATPLLVSYNLRVKSESQAPNNK